MTNLPDRMYEAAEVLGAANKRLGDPPDTSWSPSELRATGRSWQREDDAKRAEVDELAKWLSVHVGTGSEDDWELRSKPTIWHDRAQELMDLGYRKQ